MNVPDWFKEVKRMGKCWSVIDIPKIPELPARVPKLSQLHFTHKKNFTKHQVNLNKISFEANKILNSPNAGGNSIVSEALAMEILHREYLATNIYTEMEINYFCDEWKKCDFVTRIKGSNVGVSVTRVLRPFPARNPKSKKSKPIQTDEAYVADLLHKKLYGLVVSRAGALNECVFSESILFAWVPDSRLGEILKQTFENCSNKHLKRDIKLIIVKANEQQLRSDFRENMDVEIELI